MTTGLRPDWDDLIWRIAVVTAELHEEIGDRAALLAAKTELWKEAEQLGLLVPRFARSDSRSEGEDVRPKLIRCRLHECQRRRTDC